MKKKKPEDRLAWTKEYLDDARSRAELNAKCERRWYGATPKHTTDCSNKAKHIVIFSEIGGAWSIIICSDCARRIKEGNDDPTHPDYDCDTAVVLIHPINEKLIPIK